jgi:hypothetical protein
MNRMSEELELLDQLLTNDFSLEVCRSFFSSQDRFVQAVLWMLNHGEIELLDHAGKPIPRWQWKEVVGNPNYSNAATLRITDAGVRRFEG